MNPEETQQQAVAALEALGAEIGVDNEGNVVSVLACRTEITDEEVHLLSGLTKLEHLDIRGTQITDAGLVHLIGLTNLQECYFTVARPGLDALKKALPNCYFADHG